MRRIVVDTNIAFSTFLNVNSHIGQILLYDTPFVAINDYVRGRLWTGDVKLLNGLTIKGYKRIVTTNELYTDFIQKENKK